MLELYELKVGRRVRILVATGAVETNVAVEPRGDEIVNLVDREDGDRRGHISRSMLRSAR